ncbi:MAG: class I SAM-dependent methyltransferase [Pseudomonadota bacterium]
MSDPSHSYGDSAARHYGAYRPPLHQPILLDALGESRFKFALDIGCGTGWSTRALESFAEQIIGVDNSPAMLATNEESDRVEYRLGDGERLPVETGTVDLVTMAGVLPYLNKPSLLREVQRIAKPTALVLVYDFRVEMEPLLRRLQVDLASPLPGYNHSDNLDDAEQLENLTSQTRRISFAVSAQEAAHLVLASDWRFRKLSDHSAGADPHSYVQSQLAASISDITLEAMTWSSLYRVQQSTTSARMQSP